MYLHIGTASLLLAYIYIYIERERERESNSIITLNNELHVPT